MKKEFQLYIVPAPIGNIEDITLRAIAVLKSVDIIACEDSRITRKLLYRYDIKTKLISYHKFNEKQRVKMFLELIKKGKKIALIPDAGTPLISDPGNILISELRKNNVKITSLPGACAITTFISQIPKSGEEFAFAGFLPKNKGQIFAVLQKFACTNLVFYESPNRLLKTLEAIKEFNPDAKIAVGRELTKIFEEIVIDNIENVIDYFKNNILKGEIVAMVYKKDGAEFCKERILEKIELLKRKKFGAKDISTILAGLYDLNKNDIYKMII